VRAPRPWGGVDGALRALSLRVELNACDILHRVGEPYPSRLQTHSGALASKESVPSAEIQSVEGVWAEVCWWPAGCSYGTVSSLPLSAVDNPPRACIVVQSRAVKPWPRAGLPWLLPHVHEVELVGCVVG
jgi:hypothetical protein